MGPPASTRVRIFRYVTTTYTSEFRNHSNFKWLLTAADLRKNLRKRRGLGANLTSRNINGPEPIVATLLVRIESLDDFKSRVTDAMKDAQAGRAREAALDQLRYI